MKLFMFIVTFTTTTLFAKPYYSEYVDNDRLGKQYTISFYSDNISDRDEPKIKILEKKYLEYSSSGFDYGYKSNRWHLEKELNALGVTVEVLENSTDHQIEKIPQPLEFHHYNQKSDEKK